MLRSAIQTRNRRTMRRMAKTALTETDREIVRLIEEGLDTEDIAEALFLGRYTVKSKIQRMRALVGGDRMTDLPERVEAFDRVGV